MSAQPTLATIWQTIQNTIATASGLTTVWRFQNYDQPAVDYVGISLGAFAPEGYDYTQEAFAPSWQPSTTYAAGDRVLNDTGPRTYSCTTAGTSAGAGGPTGTGSAITDGSVVWQYLAPGSEVSITVGGVREVALQIEAWSASTVEDVAKATALSICDGIATKLRLPTARQALATVGMTPFDPGPTNWIPSIVAANFRGRATCDVRCRLPARALVDYAAFIASLSVAVSASGAAGGSVTETVTAP